MDSFIIVVHSPFPATFQGLVVPFLLVIRLSKLHHTLQVLFGSHFVQNIFIFFQLKGFYSIFSINYTPLPFMIG